MLAFMTTTKIARAEERAWTLAAEQTWVRAETALLPRSRHGRLARLSLGTTSPPSPPSTAIGSWSAALWSLGSVFWFLNFVLEKVELNLALLQAEKLRRHSALRAGCKRSLTHATPDRRRESSHLRRLHRYRRLKPETPTPVRRGSKRSLPSWPSITLARFSARISWRMSKAAARPTRLSYQRASQRRGTSERNRSGAARHESRDAA